MVFLQWQWPELDATGRLQGHQWQCSRLFYVGALEAITEEQVVRAAWALLQIAVEHETREFFWYGDSRPFEPHRSLLAGVHPLDLRG